jgi:UDP-glucose 4-epimerase
MKILLTGGHGFIGSNLIKKFNREFDFVVISSKKGIDTGDIKTEYISVTNKKIVKIIETLNPDIIIHLAALSGLKKCENDPKKAFEVNVTGTKNIVEGCLKTNAKLIFISSREVYGSTINEKSNEDDMLNPDNIYGQTKVNAEKIIQNAAKNFELNYVILRLTNVYGPGSNSGVNRIIRESLSKEKILVNGGEQILNFIFIEDVIELIYLVILNNKLSKQILNIGSNDTSSLKKFVELLEELLNDPINVQYGEKPSFESLFFCPDIKKQQNILGYDFKYSLKEGIIKTLQYMRINS